MTKRFLESRHTVFATTLLCITAAIATIIAGELFDVRYYLTSSLVIVLSVVPFFVSFERRRLNARELVAVAVLCALAVASRVAFIALPSIKPLVGVVMIVGIAFGPQTGYFVGAVSALVSNLIFGQGPWTPWQMFAYGAAGLAAGMLVKARVIPCRLWNKRQRIMVSILGFLVVVCVVGPILDTASLFTMVSVITPESAFAIYISGLVWANLPHGIATFVTLFFLGNPLLKKLYRVIDRYGLMGNGSSS